MTPNHSAATPIPDALAAFADLAPKVPEAAWSTADLSEPRYRLRLALRRMDGALAGALPLVVLADFSSGHIGQLLEHPRAQARELIANGAVDAHPASVTAALDRSAVPKAGEPVIPDIDALLGAVAYLRSNLEQLKDAMAAAQPAEEEENKDEPSHG